MKIAKSNLFSVLLTALTVGAVSSNSILAADYSRVGAGNWSDAVWTVGGTTNQTWTDGNQAIVSIANENELILNSNVSLTGLQFSGLGVSDSASLTGSQTLAFTGDSAVFNVATGTLNASVALTGAFTKTGAGTLNLTSFKTSTTPINVQEGTLMLSVGEFDSPGLSNTNLNLASGTRLEIAKNFVFGAGMITADNASVHLSGNQNYLNRITLKNGATVTAQNGSSGQNDDNSYRVGFNYGGVNAPTLNVEGTSGSTINAGITMVQGGNGYYTMNVASTGDASGVDLTINGKIFDYSNEVGLALKKTGAGTLKLTNNANSWVSGFLIDEGKVILAANNAGGKGDVVAQNGTSLVLTQGITASLKSLTGGIAISAEDSGATLVLGSGITDANNLMTLSSSISSNVTLVKDGAGTLELTKTPGQIGGLTVNAGTFSINDKDAGYSDVGFGNAPITINKNAKFHIAAQYAIKGSAITLDGGSIHIVASQLYLNNLTLKNGATISANSNSTNNADKNSFRVGNNYGTGKNPVTVVSGSSASSIAADVLLTAHGSTQWNLTVNSTGDASGVDLVISGQLRDYANATNQAIPIAKSGEGVVRLANDENLWTLGAVISEGTIQLAGAQSAGFGVFTLNGTGSTIDLLASNAGGAESYQIKAVSGNGKITASKGDAKLVLGKVVAANGTVYESEDFTLAAQIASGVTLEKVGSNTLLYSRDGGNGTAFNALVISEGTVALAASGSPLSAASAYGSLGNTPITVTNSGKLLVVDSWNLQGTPLFVVGEDAAVEFQNSQYANRVTLTDGADITGNEYRVGYTTFAPILNVDGLGNGSEISTKTFMLVNNTNAMDKNYAALNVQDTGANDVGNPDLRISSLIKDHPGLEGMSFQKTGDGALELTNSSNSWVGGIDVLEGSLWLVNGAAGAGTVSVRNGALLGAVPTKSETYVEIPVANFEDGASLGLQINSCDEFSRFDFANFSFIDDFTDGFIEILLANDANASTDDLFKISNSIPGDATQDLNLEAWLLPEFRNDWNLNWYAGTNALILSMDGNAVPEPAAWSLLVLGALGLWRLRTSKKEKRA